MRSADEFSAALAALRRSVALAQAEAARFPDPVAAVIREHGLWKLWVPERFGGAQRDLPSSLALFQAAAAIDGGIGFALAIGAGGGLFGAWLPEQTAREIFGPRDALIAGSGAPGGVATPVADGFVVDGRWRYASLVHQATWVTASTRRRDTDAVMAVAVPAARVRVVDDWQVHALRATDSQTIEISGLHVPASHTFSLAHAPRLAGTLYRFPFEALAAAAFAAVAVGIAAGAVDSFAAKLEHRAPAGPGMAERLSRAAGRQRSASAYLMATVQAAWQELPDASGLSDASDAGVHLAAVSATAQAVAAVEELAEVAGMGLLDERDRFSRCWRDVHGVAQHALVSQSRHAALGERLLRLRGGAAAGDAPG